MKKILVCSCEEDADAAEKIEENLKEKYEVILSCDEVGTVLPEFLQKNMKDFSHMILLMSHKWLCSSYSSVYLYWMEAKCHDSGRANSIVVNRDLTQDELKAYDNVYSKEISIDYKDTPAFYQELSNMIEEQREISDVLPSGDMGHGFAWAYFFAYIKHIAVKFHDVKEKFLVDGGPRFVDKILIPVSHNATSLKYPVNVKFKQLEKWEVNRAGHLRKEYPLAFYTVTCESDQSKRFLSGQNFPTVILNMSDMISFDVTKGKVTPERVEKEMEIFTKTLNDIFQHYAYKCEAFLYQDADDFKEKVLKHCEDVSERMKLDAVAPKVYLAYDDTKADQAEYIYTELKNRGMEVFEMGLGETMITESEKCIRKSTAIVFIMSHDTYTNDKFIKREIYNAAVRQGERSAIIVWTDKEVDERHQFVGVSQIKTYKYSKSQAFIDDLEKDISRKPLTLMSQIPSGDIAYPFAVAHFFGYLHLIMKEDLIPTKFVEWAEQNYPDEKNVPMMLAIIPNSCKSRDTMEDYNSPGKKDIQRLDPKIELQVTRGPTKMNYSVWAYRIRDPANPAKSFIAVVDLVSVVLNLADMMEDTMARLPGHYLASYREAFVMHLCNLFEQNKHTKGKVCIVQFDDDKDILASRLAETCEMITNGDGQM